MLRPVLWTRTKRRERLVSLVQELHCPTTEKFEAVSTQALEERMDASGVVVVTFGRSTVAYNITIAMTTSSILPCIEKNQYTHRQFIVLHFRGLLPPLVRSLRHATIRREPTRRRRLLFSASDIPSAVFSFNRKAHSFTIKLI